MIPKIYGGESEAEIIIGSTDDSAQVKDGMASFNIQVS